MEGFAAKKRRLVQEWERRYLTNLLHDCRGNVTQAADLAQVDRANFLRLLKRHDISAGRFRPCSVDQIDPSSQDSSDETEICGSIAPGTKMMKFSEL